jgi:hypothetical protein
VLFHLDAFPDAEAVFSELVEQRYEEERSLVMLAQAQFKQGKLRAARATIARIRANWPSNGDAAALSDEIDRVTLSGSFHPTRLVLPQSRQRSDVCLSFRYERVCRRQVADLWRVRHRCTCWPLFLLATIKIPSRTVLVE